MQVNGSFTECSLCEENVFHGICNKLKAKHETVLSFLRMLAAGFLQIGKKGSGHVLTLCVVSQKADDRFLFGIIT